MGSLIGTDRVTGSALARLAATIDHRVPIGAVPILWHWAAFLGHHPTGDLGPDGHVRSGGFIENPPGERRMYAGTRMTSYGRWPVDAEVERRTALGPFIKKSGAQGPLTFVTVTHTYLTGGKAIAVEEQDLVYRPLAPRGPWSDGGTSSSPGREGGDTDRGSQLKRRFGTVELFRFSAVTFNSHRIHYDADYARNVEGYPALVVQGPLLALHLAVLAADAIGQPLTTFSCRARSPAFVGDQVNFTAEPAAEPSRRVTLTASRDGIVLMSGEAGS